jgi:hypothetical protein
MTSYEFRTHRWTATYYAIRLCNGQITGVCGPLPESARTERGDLAVYEYDDRPEVLLRARRNPDQFGLADAWRRGRPEGWPAMS